MLDDSTALKLQEKYKVQIEAAGGTVHCGRSYGHGPAYIVVSLPSTPKVNPENILQGEGLKFMTVHAQVVPMPKDNIEE